MELAPGSPLFGDGVVVSAMGGYAISFFFFFPLLFLFFPPFFLFAYFSFFLEVHNQLISSFSLKT